MYILGISAFYHDSAAALIRDGKVVVAVEEERFSRIKHDNRFPYSAIEFCLRKEGIKIDKIDHIAYYEKPLLKFERILSNFVETYPYSIKSFLKGLPPWLIEKIKIEYLIKKKLGYRKKVFFIPHHLSHAASVYFTSADQEMAIATIDGVGEYETVGLWHAKGKEIKPLKFLEFPNSLGLLYSTFTAFLGFSVNEDEYKVMGLAAYGRITYVKKIYKILDIKPDGSFQLDMNYFAFKKGHVMWTKRFENLFGDPRKKDEPIQQRHKDLAAGIQKVTEEIYFTILNHLHSLTDTPFLGISGGVALNSLANGKIYDNTPFKKIHIYGAAGDSGAAVGAAALVYHSVLDHRGKKADQNLYLGSDYGNKEIEAVLKGAGLTYSKFQTEHDLIDKSAKLLAENKVIGWFQGRMEFGPRALGARSILANPRMRKMKERVNVIKIREQFRPFAGMILQDNVHEYFKVPEKDHASPFMNFCFQVRKEKRADIAAIVHKDNSCRIQTVNSGNGRVFALLKKFHALTNVPCLLNTSFNLKGEPLVESPKQAVEDFLKTSIDYLIIGDYIVSKS